MEENMQKTVSYDLIVSEKAMSANYGCSLDIKKVKATSKRRAPTPSTSSSAPLEKLQKLDLSLEAYVHVLLSVQQDLHLHRLNYCSLDNLRKVLLANNLSVNRATKEFIVAHLHELPLFKPFFSSIGGLNNNIPIGIKHADLVEDLNALQWLENGRVLVEADARSFLGVPVKNASSSARHPLSITPYYCSNFANPYPASLNNGCEFMEKFSCTESQVSDLKLRSAICTEAGIAKRHHNNLPEIVQNNAYKAQQSVMQLDQGLSTPEGSRKCVFTELSEPYIYDNTCMYAGKFSSCFTSGATNAFVPICKSQQKNLEKSAPELLTVINLDPPQCATQAHVADSEPDRSPCSSSMAIILHSGMNITSSEASHQQPDATNNSSLLTVADENILCPDGELTLLQQLSRTEGQKTSNSTLQLPSQDVMTQNALKQLSSLQNFNRKDIENTFIDSSSQVTMTQLPSQKLMDRNAQEESTLSTSNRATHDILMQPMFPQNLNNYEEGREVFTSSNPEKPSQSKRAIREIVPRACPQPLHRKEGDVTIKSASQGCIGMEILDKASTALHYIVAPPIRSTVTAARNTLVKTPSDQLNKVAHADSVQLVSPKISGYAAGQERIFACSPAQEASLGATAADHMEPNFDPASAAFLEALSDSTAPITPRSRGSLSACNENSLDLLDRWEKRRQQAVRGRIKTEMLQEKRARSGKRLHLQQRIAEVWEESEGGEHI